MASWTRLFIVAAITSLALAPSASAHHHWDGPNKSHVYVEVAGLRLDTSSVGDRGGKSGVRWRPPIGKRFGFAVRHISGL